jgi:long-chain acyl-CoA synthetase
VACWADGIATATEPGEVVVVATANGYEQLLLCLAACRAGAVAAPLNSQMGAAEVDAIVADASARLVLRSADDVPASTRAGARAGAANGVHGEARRSPRPDDLAALFYTSGTTGRPKGVEQTHRALLGRLLPGVAWPAALHRDLAVVSLPISHIMGFVTTLTFACTGVPVCFLPRFDASAVLGEIEHRRATMFVGVPAMYRMLIEAGAEHRDLRSVRLWMSGADVMPADLAERFKKLGALADLPVVGPVGEAVFAEGYGMVETGGGGAAKISLPFLRPGLGGSVGLPMPGYRFKVVDEAGNEVRRGTSGELLIRGPGVTRGYRGEAGTADGAIDADGWLRTGDLGRVGYFGLVGFEGRKKDVIKAGGYSVYALEVERALDEHPDVIECCVVGLPDDGCSLDPAALRAFLADRLASYKVPRRFVAVDDLPRTDTDKIRRRDVLAFFD